VRPGNQTDKLALFVPATPGETGDVFLLTHNRLFDHGAALPLMGTRTNQYGVAAMDPFGRWSDWSPVELDLTPRLPEAPRLMALSLTADMTRRTGNLVPHELMFEILWDWQDRSPKRFQLAAVFHARRTLPDGTMDDGHLPPTTYPPIFQTDNTAAAGPFLELTFLSDSPPGTSPAFDAVPTSSDSRATIELLPPATNSLGQNVEGEMRRYRVRLADLSVAFEPDEEWFFSLFVKAAEWRNPSVLSDSTPPLPPGRPPRLTAYVPNPIPADPPVFLPATVLWSSLPDAQGASRFRLTFDRVATATGGYAIYQAYEAKLCELAHLPAPTGVDLVARATALRDTATPLVRSTDAFTRVNATLVPQPPAGTPVDYEVELPGTLDGLVAFAVSAVTRTQEASPLSTPWLFVAVPRRAVPARPTLALAANPNGTVALTCEFAKAPTPARIEIFRVRRELAARDTGTMGPPIHESGPDAWQGLDEQGRPATSGADTARFRFAFVDTVAFSWFAYHYRAIGFGVGDDSTGLVPGRSPQSNLVTVERLPTVPPTMAAAESEQAGADEVTVRFQSDASIEVTPHGSFSLEVSAYDFAEAQFVEPSALRLFLPLAQPRPADGVLSPGALYAAEPDDSGTRLFEALLDVTGDKYLFRLRLTDPLGRSSERLVSGEMEVNLRPDLQGLRLRREQRDLFIAFRSSTTTDPLHSGQFELEINFIRRFGGGVDALLTTALHEIPEGDLDALRTSPVTKILRSATTPHGQASEYGAVVKRFFPALPFPPPPRGEIQVRLTGPDGTSVQLRAEP
jgi:hypothetical protein